MAMLPECNHPVTALCVAASCGHEGVVEVLLRAGARADMQVGSGYTPLYLAAQGGHERCVSLILEAHPEGVIRHALMEFATADGATPLMVAAHQGHTEVVGRLLSQGANTLVPTPDGTILSARELANATGHRECAELICAFEMHTSRRMSM